VLIRAVVADDQPVVRAGFGTILGAQPDIEVVGEAGDGREAVRVARDARADVVLMDIRMPVLDGIEATRQLAGAGVHDPVKVLVLTTFDLDEYVYEALRAGASGFLLKDVARDELVHAVRVVAQGDALIAPNVTRRLIAEFARLGAPSVAPGPALDSLTARERDVLELIARGLTNAEIAERLIVGEATVKSHVAHVLQKLAVRDRTQAVIAAYEAGLVRPGAAGPGHV
jgi:DNA-binding NarL/FixJ family response regulator